MAMTHTTWGFNTNTNTSSGCGEGRNGSKVIAFIITIKSCQSSVAIGTTYNGMATDIGGKITNFPKLVVTNDVEGEPLVECWSGSF